MKAVILAAARSDRLKPFTETRAKPMIWVAGRPTLEYVTAALRESGITEILLVVNHKRETIERHFEHGHRFGVSFDYIVQEPLDGIGGALRRCRASLGSEPFLLVYGDILTTGAPFSRVMAQYAETGTAVAAIALPTAPADFGAVYLDQEMRIVELVEKPKDPNLANHVFAGIFLLQPGVFDLLDAAEGDIEQTYQALIRRRELQGTLWDGGWIDLTRPWHILEANRMLMDLWDRAEIHHSVRLEGQVHIEGPVRIEENVSIGSGSVLKGPCYIGRNSYIGNNTLIREYSSLGPESVVGYGTELKNCVLFGRSVLGRLSFIGDSVIGERAHLGTGVTTVNVHDDMSPVFMETEQGPVPTGLAKLGAFIGDDVRIGARHVLEPGTRIRAGARIVDQITQRSIL